MPTTDTLTWSVDLDALLAPLPGPNPAGVPLRDEAVYDQIDEARREDDPSLPQGVWQTALKRADWPGVETLCLKALTTRSKDLWIATRLLEAWLHLHDFAGAAPGLLLMTGLCDRFWDTLYPGANGGDLDARLAPVHVLNEKLSLTLKQIPLTQPRLHDVATCTWASWEASFGVQRSALAHDATAEARLYQSVAATDTSFFASLAAAVDEAVNALAALDTCLTARCGAQAPALGQCSAVLSGVKQLLATVLAQRTGNGNGSATGSGDVTRASLGAAAPLADEAGGSGSAVPAFTPLALHGRTEAYQRLAEIADYLLRIEPHSPTPYLLRRAVSWGSMPLQELLLELVQHSGDLEAIYALLGIRRREEQE